MKFAAILASALAMRIADNYLPLNSNLLKCEFVGGACTTTNSMASAGQTAVCAAKITGSFETDEAKKRACNYVESSNGPY